MPRMPRAAGLRVSGARLLHDPHRPKPHGPWAADRCPARKHRRVASGREWETSRQVGTGRLSSRTTSTIGISRAWKLYRAHSPCMHSPSRIELSAHRPPTSWLPSCCSLPAWRSGPALQLVGQCHFGEIMMGACSRLAEPSGLPLGQAEHARSPHLAFGSRNARMSGVT
jgi:hypothetical protein